MRQDPGLLSQQIQEIARKVPDPLSIKAGSGNETTRCPEALKSALFRIDVQTVVLFFDLACNQALASLWAVMVAYLSSPRLPLPVISMLPEGRSLRSPATGLLTGHLLED